MTEAAHGFAYDEVPYPTLPFPECHPDRLATVGTLYGLEVADPASCSYLDIGCGNGGNLLAVAASLPGSRCVGFDLSPVAIERGRQLAAAAGVGNAALYAGDVLSPPAEVVEGSFDYVVAHGVYSWVAPEVRERTMALIAGALAPGGIAYVSYNAMPGWFLRGLHRAIGMRHAAAESDGAARVARGIEGIKLVLDLRASEEGPEDLYTRVLRSGLQYLEERDPNVVFHDEFADHCQPFAVDEVCADAEAHGLSFLGEATFTHWWEWSMTPTDAWRLRTAAGPSLVARQAYADMVGGRAFKTTLFVRGSGPAAGSGKVDLARVREMSASIRRDAEPPATNGDAASSVHGLLKSAFPAAVPFSTMHAEVGASEDALARVLLQRAAVGGLSLHVHPPTFALTAGEFPTAHPLARAQAALGRDVATLRHDHVAFEEPLGRLLLTLMDGTRDRAALLEGLVAGAVAMGAEEESLREGLADGFEDNIDELARLGLLVA